MSIVARQEYLQQASGGRYGIRKYIWFTFSKGVDIHGFHRVNLCEYPLEEIR